MKRKKLHEVHPLLDFEGLENPGTRKEDFLLSHEGKTAMRSSPIARSLFGMKELHARAYYNLTTGSANNKKLQSTYKDIFFVEGKGPHRKTMYIYEAALPWYLFSMFSGILTRSFILSHIWQEAKRTKTATEQTKKYLEELNASDLTYAQLELAIANTELPVPVVTYKQASSFLALMPRGLSSGKYRDGSSLVIPMTTAEYGNDIYGDAPSRITQSNEQKLIVKEGGTLTVFGLMHLVMNLIADYHVDALPKVTIRQYRKRAKDVKAVPITEVPPQVMDHREDVLTLLMKTQGLLESGLNGSIDPEQTEAVLMETYGLRIKMLKS